MALNYAIRRVASRVVPLAIRDSAGSQRFLHHHPSSALLAAVNHNTSRNVLQRPFPSLLRHCSSNPSSDESFLQVIESEIQCAVESQDGEEAEEAPQGFPFKIEDHPGQQTITLTREYQGETVTVKVHMPNLVTGEEHHDDDNDEEVEKSGNQSSMLLVVRVSKNTGPSLLFGCCAYPDEIFIDSLSVDDPNNSGDQIAYHGPDFGDLDDNLQKAFYKYLEIRGIRPTTTNFLHGYMLDKDSREYIQWLKTIRKFVQS